MNYDRKFYLLLFFAVALVAAETYLYMGVRSLSAEAGRIRGSLTEQVSALHQKTAEVSAADTERVDEVLREVDSSKRESAMAALLAKYQAQARVEQLAADIARTQRYHREEVNEQLTGIQAATVDANRKIGELSTNSGEVKSEAQAARTDADRAAADLARIRGELDKFDAAIATNHEELEALRAHSGEREYTEFNLPKSKQPQNIAGVLVTLKKTDPQRHLFSLDITTAGKTIEQRAIAVNEPVRLNLEPGHVPFEIVVNQITKDSVSGYVATPKNPLTAHK